MPGERLSAGSPESTPLRPKAELRDLMRPDSALSAEDTATWRDATSAEHGKVLRDLLDLADVFPRPAEEPDTIPIRLPDPVRRDHENS